MAKEYYDPDSVTLEYLNKGMDDTMLDNYITVKLIIDNDQKELFKPPIRQNPINK